MPICSLELDSLHKRRYEYIQFQVPACFWIYYRVLVIFDYLLVWKNFIYELKYCFLRGWISYIYYRVAAHASCYRSIVAVLERNGLEVTAAFHTVPRQDGLYAFSRLFYVQILLERKTRDDICRQKPIIAFRLYGRYRGVSGVLRLKWIADAIAFFDSLFSFSLGLRRLRALQYVPHHVLIPENCRRAVSIDISLLYFSLDFRRGKRIIASVFFAHRFAHCIGSSIADFTVLLRIVNSVSLSARFSAFCGAICIKIGIFSNLLLKSFLYFGAYGRRSYYRTASVFFLRYFLHFIFMHLAFLRAAVWTEKSGSAISGDCAYYVAGDYVMASFAMTFREIVYVVEYPVYFRLQFIIGVL